MTRYLVTMALPYANGSLHLGHMVEAVQTDIYVRALRAMGHEAVFICADDQHGTPIEVNARKAGVTPEAFVAQWYEEHKADYLSFGVEHDEFYKTHSDENRRHSERVFEALRAKGMIEKRPVEQFYCEVDKRFLPDRFVKGICPNCGARDQYGDSCEVCGATYEPTDLKDPKCAICGTAPVRRSSDHYFVQLSKSQAFLERWTSQEGVLQPEIKNFVDGWMKERLKDWDISREAPYFGFNIPGEPDKYFYVWLDACIGYLATAEHHFKEKYREWWPKQATDELLPTSGVRVEHFIGKDIVYFHTLFWPAELNASGDQRPSRVHVHGFLGIEGGKMSKSRGTFVNARQYLDAGLEAEWLRYFFASNLGPNVSDIDLSFSEMKNRVNGELLNNVGNLANRALNLLHKNFQGRYAESVPDFDFDLETVWTLYRACDTRSAIQEVLGLSSLGNELMQREQPWKQTDKAQSQKVLTQAVQIARLCGRLLAPVLPHYAEGLAAQSGGALDMPLAQWLKTKVTEPKPLIRRVEDADIKKLTDTFVPKEAPPETPAFSIDQFNLVDLRAGKIISCERAPKKDKLLKLTVDLGEASPRTIISGVAQSYQPEELVGKMVVVVANLPPREFGKGLASHGMVLYSSGGKREHTAVELPAEVTPGSKVK